jgi:dihydroorotase
MAQHFDLIVHGGTVVTAVGHDHADIGISGGHIVEIGNLASAEATERFDAKGLHVLPGVIDSQVHFREPGNEHKEDLASGTAAAALGGVTAVFEMPNTNPPTTTTESIADKVARATGRAWTDFAFFVGATAENADDIGRLERSPGCCGVKIFMGSSTGNLLVPDDATVERILKSGSRRVAVHAEDEARLNERKPLSETGGVSQHPIWRDVETARLATERVLAIARKTRRAVHVLHVTTAEEMVLLADRPSWVSVECTPQHLTLAAPEAYEQLGTYAQMNPPIREARHRDGLWQGLANGVVDVIGSDHAPHTAEEKARPYPESPSGMPGVQTLLPLMLDHMNAGRLDLDRLVDLISAAPARLYRVHGKGAIRPGNDADLTVVDLKAERTITADWLAAKCGWSPFEGKTVTGWPIATIIRGQTVMRDDELIGAPAGAPVRFDELLEEDAA